jgi:hypothetical protein
MQPLKKVISELRREISLALADEKPLPNSARLVAARVTVSLGLSVSVDDLKTKPRLLFGVTTDAVSGRPGVRRNESPTQHTITFEFSVANLASSAIGSAISVASSQSGGLQGAERERVIGIFADVLGPPGFDSSAKATVLREALAELPVPDVVLVIESLRGAPLPGKATAAKRARHFISNVVKSGPIGSAERGGEMLAPVFQAHSVPAILRLLEDVWKTQEYWLNRS